MSKLIDQAFVAAIKDRIAKVREAINVEDTVTALQACVNGTKELSKEQIAAAKILLAKVIPDLKAVEHTNTTPRDLTREQLLERLANLHAGSTRQHERPPTHGTGDADGATEVQH